MQAANSKENHLQISDINLKIQESINSKLGSSKFWIQGEIGQLKISKGHCHLTLIEKELNRTDPKASIKGIIWSSKFVVLENKFKQSGIELAENIRILFLASVNYNIQYGLSLVIEDIEPAFTLGLMIREREDVVRRLKNDRDYNLNRNLRLPLVIQRIAVISAKDAKGFEDFMEKIRSNRFNYKFSITLFTSLLQGENAAKGMRAQLINIFNNIRNYDIVTILRGGGDNVNLSCFNEYDIARPVARFPIPVITGIGHNANVSVVDEVAHMNKITPTDVANFIIEHNFIFEKRINETFGKIVMNSEKFKSSKIHSNNIKLIKLKHNAEKTRLNKSNEIANYRVKIRSAIGNIVRRKSQLQKDSIAALKKSTASVFDKKRIIQIRKLELLNKVHTLQIRSLSWNLSAKFKTLDRSLKEFFKAKMLNEKSISDKLLILDPQNTLKRGFSITKHKGKALKKSGSVKINDEIVTVLYNGELTSKIINQK